MTTTIPSIGTYESIKLLNVMTWDKMNERSDFEPPTMTWADDPNGLYEQLQSLFVNYYDYLFPEDLYDIAQTNQERQYTIKPDYRERVQAFRSFFNEESVYRRYFQKYYQEEYEQYQHMATGLQNFDFSNDLFLDGIIAPNQDQSVIHYDTTNNEVGLAFRVNTQRIGSNQIWGSMTNSGRNSNNLDLLSQLAHQMSNRRLRRVPSEIIRQMVENYDTLMERVEQVKEEVNTQTQRDQQRSEEYNAAEVKRNLLPRYDTVTAMHADNVPEREQRAAIALKQERGLDEYVVPQTAIDERLVPINGKAKVIAGDRMDNEQWYALPYATPDDQVPEGYNAVGRYGIMNDVCDEQHRPSPERFVVVEVHMFVKLWRSFWERYTPEEHEELRAAFEALLEQSDLPSLDAVAPAEQASSEEPDSDDSQGAARAEEGIAGEDIPQGVYRMHRNGTDQFRTVMPDGEVKTYPNPILAIEAYREVVNDHDGSVYNYDNQNERVFRIQQQS